jgi:hypothetical protein
MNITQESKGIEALMAAAEKMDKDMSVNPKKEENTCSLDEECLSCGS